MTAVVLRDIDFSSWLASRTSTRVEVIGKNGLPMSGESLIIPPLNTNIILARLPKKKPVRRKLARAVNIPINYRLDIDGQYAIFQPGPRGSMNQQYSCGCCWAYSMATAVADVFAVSNNYATNPNLSWTYLLACYPNPTNPITTGNTTSGVAGAAFPNSLQCGGGDIAYVSQWIAQNGLSTSVCVDYSWCANNSLCTTSGATTDQMNALIPSCGCYESGDFLNYTIRNVEQFSVTDPVYDANVLILQLNIKEHILQYGTVVGCFLVFSNLTNNKGNFKTTLNPEGVYLECVGISTTNSFQIPTGFTTEDADTCPLASTAATPLSLLGAHAVAVVGWGQAAVDPSLISPAVLSNTAYTINKAPDGKNIMVPYWWVRNSWGNTFGEGGYFKMAMYPFNRVSQFERAIQVNSRGSPQGAGGFVVFEAGTITRVSRSQNNGLGNTSSTTTTILPNKNNEINSGYWPNGRSTTEFFTTDPYNPNLDVIPAVKTLSTTTLAPPPPPPSTSPPPPSTSPPPPPSTSLPPIPPSYYSPLPVPLDIHNPVSPETPPVENNDSSVKIGVLIGCIVVLLLLVLSTLGLAVYDLSTPKKF